MKIIKVLFVLSWSLQMHAQLILTEKTHLPVPESKTQYCSLTDTAHVLPAPKGFDLMWDFSQLQTNLKNCKDMKYEMVTVQGKQFLTDGDTYLKHDATLNEWQSVGYFLYASSHLMYTDPETRMKWPFSASSSFTDYFSGSGLNPKAGVTEAITVNGTISVTGTGTGTIISPSGGIFKNILQVSSRRTVKSLHHISSMNYSFTIYQDVHETFYYSPDFNFPIAIESSSTSKNFGGDTIRRAPAIRFATFSSTSVPNVVANQTLKVFPVPCDEHINIELPADEGEASVVLYASDGKVLEQHLLSSSQRHFTLEVKIYPPGIYLLYIENLNEVVCKKIVIAHP